MCPSYRESNKRSKERAGAKVTGTFENQAPGLITGVENGRFLWRVRTLRTGRHNPNKNSQEFPLSQPLSPCRIHLPLKMGCLCTFSAQFFLDPGVACGSSASDCISWSSYRQSLGFQGISPSLLWKWCLIWTYTGLIKVVTRKKSAKIRANATRIRH